MSKSQQDQHDEDSSSSKTDDTVVYVAIGVASVGFAMLLVSFIGGVVTANRQGQVLPAHQGYYFPPTSTPY